MKVLHILDSLNRGGAEVLLLDICRHARSEGVDLAFLATGGGNLEHDFRDSGAPFFRLQRRWPLDLKLVFGIRKILKEGGFDVLHNHQAVSGLHCYLAAIGLGVRQVLSFHGFFDDLKNRLATKFLAVRMDANVSCSNGLLEWLRNTEGIDTRGFKVIPNAADITRLQPSGKSIRSELGIAEDVPVIGMVAHFYSAPRKDHATLCRAFARAADGISGAHLVIVGKTEEGAEHKRRECEDILRAAGVMNRAHFLGMRSDIADVLDAIDINVLSSLHEGFPIALTEAMLLGKACVLSDIGPHVEISGAGRYAELFKTGDDAALAEILTRLSLDRAARERLGEEARKHATANLSIGAHIRALKALYESIL